MARNIRWLPTILGSLGAAQRDLGYYPESESFERQALDIDRSYYGEDHPKTAARLTSLAESLTYETKYDEAVAALQQALAIQQRIYGPAHPAVAETVNELGNVASMRNQLDEAEVQFRRAADIYRTVYGDHHYLVAIALSNVASVYMDKKDYPRAEQAFSRCGAPLFGNAFGRQCEYRHRAYQARPNASSSESLCRGGSGDPGRV